MATAPPLSPSTITAWLSCAHSLNLKLAGVREQSDHGPFAELVMEKGQSHEAAVLARYESEGLTVVKVPEKEDQRFETWAASSVDYLNDPGTDVLYQQPLVLEGIKGVADFLIRVKAEEGFSPWEPVDAKLARSEAKPGHILQLCFYAEAVAALTGKPPKHIHIELGSGRRETYRYEEFGPYWRRMRSVLNNLVTAEGPPEETVAEPCAYCDFCEFQPRCEAAWRAADSLVYVADLSRNDRHVLEETGVTTLHNLASGATETGLLPDGRVQRVELQAKLQLGARNTPDSPPPFVLVEPGDDPVWGHGFSLLPMPDEGDVFFDLEGHPFLTPEDGLFFLFGLLLQEGGNWQYEAFWAHDHAKQAEAAAKVVDLIAERRVRFPGMHVYHYNHTERSAMARMTEGHASAVPFRQLEETGCFVDLRPVVKNAFQVGVEKYGLKNLEKVTGFERHGEINKGAGAVLEYEEYVRTGEQSYLDNIALYNDNDVRSTMVLRDWLLSQRPASARWRDAVHMPHENNPERDEVIARLLELGQGSAGKLLGELLGYWRRESSAEVTPKFEQARLPVADLIDEPDLMTGLEVMDLKTEAHATDPELEVHTATVRFPNQVLSESWYLDEKKSSRSLLMAGADLTSGFADLKAFDAEAKTATIAWKQRIHEPSITPTTVILHDWITTKPKPDVIETAALAMLNNGQLLNPATEQLLLAAAPRFIEGRGPAGGKFNDVVADICNWIDGLDRSVVAIQGPPGTGKTYRGARIVRRLLDEGYRVGVMAPSHKAIDNFFAAVIKHFNEEGIIDQLKAGRKISNKGQQEIANHVGYHTGNPAVARAGKYNLVGGTSWFFCSKEMRENPVDFLIIDEAGQIALADAAAASLVASNILLLGDPQQLEQVSHAAHPDDAGTTPLEHLLQGAATIEPDRGVFIEETWRMHPSICSFISSQMYDDRLRSHESCEQQQVLGHGSGLRWMQVHHTGRSTSAPEEAKAIVGKIRELLGTDWVDQEGNRKPLTTEDFMVVAPFNDQKDEIRRLLEADPKLAPISGAVGTVDKFQGREAPVVFFSMTTSSSEEISRGTDFLFSRNRLNVAVSRARCLAYLICTEELLGTRATKVDDMRLVGTLNAFVESAQQ